MTLLKESSSRRIISLFSSSFLCVMFASAMAPKESSARLLKTKPSVELQASKTLITYPCQPDWHSMSGACPSEVDPQVALTAVTKAFSKQSVYVYTVSGGRIVGEGSKVIWDLSEAGPGVYAAVVEARDNKKHRALSTVYVTVQICGDCVDSLPCPTMFVTCYDEVKAGTPITCKLVLGSAIWRAPAAYEWSARGSTGEQLSGRISGRGTYISISTNGLAGQTVYATVKVKGLDPSCSATASGSTAVKP